MKTFAFLFFLSASALELSAGENPIRRIVNLLQNMQKKIEEEGAEQEKMFEKFVCYCETNSEKLQKSVDDLTEQVPQHESSVKSKTELKAQIEEELVAHKQDREDAQSTVETSTEQRNKDKAAFDSYSAEAKSNIASIKKAVVAIRKGMGDSFLQSSEALVVQRLVLSAPGVSGFDQEEVLGFLQGKASSGSSGEIVGILEQMQENMEADLTEATEQEAAGLADFNGLIAAKNKEIASATSAIEDKTGRVGTLAVDIVNAKNDLSDTQDALAEDSNFLIELKTTCSEQVKLYDQVKKMRAEEISAVGATIKILNDDDALDLFKKTLPSPGDAFLQVSAHSSARSRARLLLRTATEKNSRALGGSKSALGEMQFVQLALRGKKVGFEKITKMMDDMVTLLGKEQDDDEQQKEYCEGEFEKSDDEKGALERKIKGLATEISEGEDSIAGLKDDIAALTQGIADLDKSVQEATETRKEESTEYTATKAANNAAVQLLGVAKNSLAKFYSPSTYKAPQRRELTEEERIYVQSGGADPRDAEEAEAARTSIAGTGVTALLQDRLDGPPPPPPMAVEAYKKQDSGGPMALIDRLTNDLKMEMQEDDMEEKEAQKDYEETMKQSAKKRATDSKTIVEKEQQKAEGEALLQKTKTDHTAESKELMALEAYVADLHGQCDFLLQNFDKRKEARSSEIDAIGKAKSVLHGADFSFVQVAEKKNLGFLQKGEQEQCPDDAKRRVALLQSLTALMKDANDACESMCRKMGQYPNCQCPDMEPPDLTPGVVTWDELYAIFDQLKESGRVMLKKYHAAQ